MRNTRDRLVSKAGRSHGTLDSLFPVLKADSGAWGFDPSDFIGFGVEGVMPPVLDSGTADDHVELRV